MAQKVLTLLLDDIDGSDARQTVEFGLDGITYQIDLNDDHADELRSLFGPFTAAARRTGGRRGRMTRVASPMTVDTPVDPAAVRAWAGAHKIPVPARGRIPAAVVAQFREAGH